MGKSYAAWKAATYFPLHQSYLSMLCDHLCSCSWDTYSAFGIIAGMKLIAVC